MPVQQLLESGEIVFRVGEDPLSVVDLHQPPRQEASLNRALLKGRAEQYPSQVQQHLEMLENHRFRPDRARQTFAAIHLRLSKLLQARIIPGLSLAKSREKYVTKPTPEQRKRYPHFLVIPTRWMDNDVYGHVNNVIYYSYFDTVVNQYLIAQEVLDIENSTVIGLVVETQCRFFKPITFPDTVYAGLRVARLGNRSVRYEIGLFRNEEGFAAAQGHFIHVYVERKTRRATTLPPEMREALEQILVP